MLNILFEGFLYENHSYSLTNYFLLKELLKFDDIHIFVKRIPFFNKTKFYEEMLDYKVYNGEKVDIIYRSAYPIDTKTNGIKTLVFITCETKFEDIDINRNLDEIINDPFLFFITPSVKSKQNLCKSNKKLSDKVFVLPHGIDKSLFYNMNLPKHNPFTFLNISAGSNNKNIDFIVKAFNEFLNRNKNSNAILILKLNKEIYKDTISQFKSDKIKVITDNLSCHEMSLLYNKAECYISAGIYEGFDLPILEASACHLPCIIAEKSPQRNLIPQQNQFECFEKKIFGTKEKLFEPKFESLVQKITDAYNRKLKVADVLGREYDINIIARQIVDYFFKKIILKQRNEKYFE